MQQIKAFLILLSASILFSGCATFDEIEIAFARATNTVSKTPIVGSGRESNISETFFRKGLKAEVKGQYSEAGNYYEQSLSSYSSKNAYDPEWYYETDLLGYPYNKDKGTPGYKTRIRVDESIIREKISGLPSYSTAQPSTSRSYNRVSEDDDTPSYSSRTTSAPTYSGQTVSSNSTDYEKPVASPESGCVKASRLSDEAAKYPAGSSAAENKLREAIRLCNDSAALHYSLGIVLYQQSKYDDAATELEAAIRINTSYVKALNALAFVYLKMPEGDRYKAKELAQQAVSLEPGNKDYVDTLNMAKAATIPPKLALAVALDDENRDGVLDASESAILKVRVENKGEGEAQKVEISPKVKGIRPGLRIEGAKFIPRISPNGSETLEFRINTSEEELQTGKATVTVNGTAQNGSPPVPVDYTVITKSSVNSPPQTNLRRANAVAVVIGNRDYKNIQKVDYALNDASLMKEYLVKTLGFKDENVILLSNAGLADFKKWFGDDKNHKGKLYSYTRENMPDVFIFYSGHGVPDVESKAGYLAPVEVEVDSIQFTGYPLETLYKNLEQISNDNNPRSITVVLDACFSGDSNSGMLIKYASPIGIQVVTPMPKAKNAVVLSSSKGDQISSWYPEKKHGLFTYYFLKTIKDNVEQGRELTAADMEKHLENNVNNQARRLYNREQNPTVSGNKNVILLQK